MAPKKKTPKKPKVDKEDASATPVAVEDALLDVQHFSHLNSLYDSDPNGFHCTATEAEAPDHGASLLEETNQMRQKRFLCDLTVATKTKSFEMHKLALASCSEYFHRLLQRDPQLQRVELHYVSPGPHRCHHVTRHHTAAAPSQHLLGTGPVAGARYG